MTDDETLRFYNDNAGTYAARSRSRHEAPPQLRAFLNDLPAGGRILELGTGGGRDAQIMVQRGFALTATDGSAGLAAEASRRLGQTVRVMQFSDLDAVGAYDWIWAAASLLHAPADKLSHVLGLIHRALVPGGRAVASFKAGDGPGRDQFGRYYNYPNPEVLEAAYVASASWTSITMTAEPGSGYDNLPTTWLWVHARK